MHELVIKGGSVALDDGWRECDVGIEQGRIAALGIGLIGEATLDARGRWVMPGGIDAHCHLDQPAWKGFTTADDFESGSISAAFGGTTCIVAFASPGPNMTSIDAFNRAINCAAGRSVIDYGLHSVVTTNTGSDLIDQFRHLVRAGVTSVKLYMTYEGFAVDDDLMLAVMDKARTFGMIVMVHAENDAAIRRTRKRLVGLGHTHLRYHSVALGEAMEREAAHRALTFAEIAGARVVIVHVSCRQTAEEIVRSRARGVNAIAETCPQYVFFSASDLDREPVEEAVKYMFTPPPRSRNNQDYLWNALEDGTVDLWSSDHSPYYLSKLLSDPQKLTFDKAGGSTPGLETRLPLLFSAGLLSGRLSLERYLDLTARNAAEVYGLAHLKGRISPGLDADLVLWDPRLKWKITQPVLHSNVEFTPYEGIDVTGKPTTVLVRGVPVVADGRLCANPGFGSFVFRTTAGVKNFGHPIEDTAPWVNR